MHDNFLRAALEQNRFFCSAELVLGRDHSIPDAESFVTDAAREPRGIRIVSLTDLPGGNPSLPPEAFASFVLEHGLSPLVHVTGKDGNRSFIEGRLHALAREGSENILVLTGDAQKSAYQGRAKPVYDVDSVLMLWLIQALRQGLQYNIGRREARTTPFDFLPGAVVNPYKTREPDQMMQFYKLALKIALGARFIITQLGFNLRKLYELKQYMLREGLDHVPVIADIYVPTATVARLMREGEISGCIISDELIRRLEEEKKPQRLERAALMLAAVRDLGFAGGHLGGFGLTHSDFMSIIDRAAAIGGDWRGKLEELIFEWPGEFYLLPPGTDGLSNIAGEYQLSGDARHLSWKQRLSMFVHRWMIRPESAGYRFFAARLKRENSNAGKAGIWHSSLAISTLYRKATLGCMSCGDCIQDHLSYTGCTMRWCYKNLRNGPCGGSRVDGSCEADAGLPCVWNLVYHGTLAAGDDPARFGRILVPPRDWCLDQTNALANRFAGLDNLCHRVSLGAQKPGAGHKGLGTEK